MAGTMQSRDAHDPTVLLAAGGFGRIMGGWARRSVAAHAHGDVQISFNLQGEAVDYRIDGRSERLHAGQALVVPSWKIHARCVDSAAAFVLVLALCPAWLVRNKAAAQALQGLTGTVRLDRETLDLLADIRAALADMKPEDASGPHPLVMALIDKLARLGARAAGGRPHAPAHAWDRRVNRAVQLARERGGHFNVEDIAAEAGISRTQFYRRFKDCFGVPPRLFLNAARMEWAVTRLISGSEPIAQISDELGFSTPGHFSRFFATHTGETPGAYRRRSVELHSGTNG